jgi:hypothetical protein
MPNRILDAWVINHRLDPHETELRVVVKPEDVTPMTEVRGRLAGPRNAFSSTIEIAYPLREIARTDTIELRMIIPEPSWWTPQTPFLYHGFLELWEDGERCERRELSHGIRWLQITPNGLRLNGKPFVLRGRVVEPPFAGHALEWREGGYNAVLTTIGRPSVDPDLWPETDRRGILVIEATNIPSHFLRWRNQAHDHASVFGWLLHPGLLEESSFGFSDHRHGGKANLFGIAWSGGAMPANASFVVVSEEELNSHIEIALPKIVVVERLPGSLPVRPDVVGWIESPTA